MKTILLFIVTVVLVGCAPADTITHEDLISAEQFLNWCCEEDYVRGNQVISVRDYKTLSRLVSERLQ